MKETTLCYILRDSRVLMLLRNKKEKDANQGKWIGVGGKMEPGESPEDCIRREVFEETGLKFDRFDNCGEIRFILDAWEDEVTYLFTADMNKRGQHQDVDPDNLECDEGELAWIERSKILELNLWEGDRFFLEEMLQGGYVNMTLHYDMEDRLIEVIK